MKTINACIAVLVALGLSGTVLATTQKHPTKSHAVHKKAHLKVADNGGIIPGGDSKKLSDEHNDNNQDAAHSTDENDTHHDQQHEDDQDDNHNNNAGDTDSSEND